MKKYQLILVPDWLGSTHKTGVEEGPKSLSAYILDSNLLSDIDPGVKEVHLPLEDSSHLEGEYSSTKFLPEIKQICEETQEKIIEIIEAGNIPIVLMGNDSSMIGAISGVSKLQGNDYGIIYFDAHGDINTPDRSPSGRLYGMPLAHLLGYGAPQLTELNGTSPSLKPENLVLVGPRALDEGEQDFINEHNVMLFSSDDVNTMPTDDIVNSISQKFTKNNISGLFIHIDLDVLDPNESHGVSMHEPDGLHVAKFFEVLKAMAKLHGNLVAISVSEYNPKMDKNNETRDIALRILTTLTKNT